MKLTHQQHEQVAVIGLQGELTLDAVEPLRKAAADRFADNTCDFVLDLTGLEFVDSKGLETMLWLQEQATERLGQLRLVSPTPNVRTILHITRLAPQFQVHHTVPAALQSLR